ncbi:MAG: TolC family outer membrane protein [Sinobacteraceae bacterium]|nr:TolC family outer membrane protein [Nevskiaceae bacterium]
MKRALLLTLGMLAATPAAVHAEDLLTVFQRAEASDPQIREADALRKASRESKPQALATLLPQVSGAAARTHTDSDGTSTSQFVLNGVLVPSDRSGKSDATNKRWSIDLRQSVFSWANWVALKRADKTVAQAEADYQAEEQALILRVGDAYFNVLAAQDTVEAQSSALEAISRQLEQADKRFEVGLIAITDVQEARAARDSAAAAVIAAKRALASAQEQLREITGEKYATLAKPGAAMPLHAPDPADEDQWVALSMEQNLALISSRLAADIARDDVRAAFSGHLPQVDLVASRSNAVVDSEQRLRTGALTTSDSDNDDTQYALQLSVPLFSGGATSSRVRQSEYRWQAARERLTRSSRQTERQARDAYLGVISEISRVNALRQALESSQTALQATEAGYEVGTRTAVDVLDARRNLVQAQTNYSRSRYDYVLNVMRLRLAAGTLDRDTLAEINGWLVERAP